eukprot:Colp12_sorted_trinity150504_noHs@22102
MSTNTKRSKNIWIHGKRRSTSVDPRLPELYGINVSGGTFSKDGSLNSSLNSLAPINLPTANSTESLSGQDVRIARNPTQRKSGVKAELSYGSNSSLTSLDLAGAPSNVNMPRGTPPLSPMGPGATAPVASVAVGSKASTVPTTPTGGSLGAVAASASPAAAPVIQTPASDYMKFVSNAAASSKITGKMYYSSTTGEVCK